MYETAQTLRFICPWVKTVPEDLLLELVMVYPIHKHPISTCTGIYIICKYVLFCGISSHA